MLPNVAVEDLFNAHSQDLSLEGNDSLNTGDWVVSSLEGPHSSMNFISQDEQL